VILVLGSVTGRPDTIDALLHASLTHVRRSRTEPGCLSHEVSIDAENPLRLVFVERWADQASLDAHFAVPASLEFVGSLSDLVDGRPTMTVHPVAD
jgi:quinol monooxygenase YgiN